MIGRIVVVGAGLACAAILALVGTGGTSQPAWAANVDSRVLADTAGGRTARFLVLLTAQADVEGAAASRDRAEQGANAVASLQRVATAQAGITAELARRRVPYTSYWVVNAIATSGGRDLVEALARRSDVAAIETDRATSATASETAVATSAAPRGVEWNIARIGAPSVWALGTTGQEIVYANADTGVRWESPTLKTHYRGWNGSAATHDFNWWDAVHGDLNGNGGNPCGFSSRVPCDDHRHGTSVMGVAVGDDGQGNQIGVAPGARWIGCRNMDEGFGSPSTYIECLQFFLAPTDLNGANPDPSKRPHVIGNSYACPPDEGCSTASLQAAIDNLRAAGVFMAVAAGNGGRSGCSTVVDPPALYDSATSVGATDGADGIAAFSSRGPVTADGSGRLKPDLVAPGVGIRSAALDGFVAASGTSAATPHVGGAVVLLWSAFPDLRGQVDETERLLQETVLRRTTTEGCGGDSTSAVPNNTYGHGRLDVLAAYRAYETAHPVQLGAASTSIAEGDRGPTRVPVELTLSRATSSTVTVRYATRPGTATAGSDFRAATGSVSFPAGARSAKLTVVVNGDTTIEPDEAFAVVLSGPENAQLTTTSVEITIRNDDTDRVAPRISAFRVSPALASRTAKVTARLTLSEPAALQCRTERRGQTGWQPTATLRRAGPRGPQAFPVRGHGVPGTYRLVCVPTDAAGNAGRTASAGFKIA